MAIFWHCTYIGIVGYKQYILEGGVVIVHSLKMAHTTWIAAIGNRNGPVFYPAFHPLGAIN
jgi:hypothetical protein